MTDFELAAVITLMVGNIAALFSLQVFKDLEEALKELKHHLKSRLDRFTISDGVRETVKLLLSVPILASNLASVAFLYFLGALLLHYRTSRYVLFLPDALQWNLTERNALVLTILALLLAVSYGCRAFSPLLKGWYLVIKGIVRVTRLRRKERRYSGDR